MKSTLAAETLAMVDGLDEAIFISKMISEVHGIQDYSDKKIPIKCYTDNKSLFDNINSTKSVSEKRLRIDIASIREMLVDKEVDIRWIPSKLQLADCLTKRGASAALLIDCLQTGVLHFVNEN